jgi:formylglycine-generating enzyme required for sulfatase activity
MQDEASHSGALLDFLEQYAADTGAGRPRALEEYLERFPEAEELIRAEYAELQAEGGARSASPASAPPRHLRERLTGPARYRREDEIGRGGMSRVFRAHDLELGRELAMKVHQAERPGPLRRFVREARVLARLDHPGVVPVHELGLDAHGRLFFTMRLVRGQSLKERLAALHARPQDTARRELLEAILRVCDTMAYAHAQGVIHRDLKPSNVMLGQFGAVYVVDWGLARVLEQSDEVGSEHDGALLEPEVALATLSGDVLGTPAYMSPEQARGEQAELGPRTDVYSVGAILYHLLAGHAPFFESDTTPPSSQVLARVRQGPPRALARAHTDSPPELVSICEHAMARSPEDRYRTCADMAADLRAFLDGRVVRAHRTGALQRARKWVRRNRSLAGAVSGALVLAAGALFSWSEVRAKESSLSLLADLRGPLELLQEFESLWPADPDHRPAIEQWVARAEDLRAHGARYERQLQDLRRDGARVPDSEWVRRNFAENRAKKLASAERALEMNKAALYARENGFMTASGSSAETLRANQASMERELLALRARPEEKESWNFSDPQEQLLHDRLDQFLAELDFVIGRLEARDRPNLARAALERIEAADAAADSRAERSWDAVARAVASDARFQGLSLLPQRGLIPLGPDPRSGLPEFAHAQSGRAPERDASGDLLLAPDMAIVLVLLPPAQGTVGAQLADASAANYDPWTERFEGPPLETTMGPFFLSKYELTLAQWSRLSGEPTEVRLASTGSTDPLTDGLLPAGGMTGTWASTVLSAYSLELPTSIYWEYAARAGSSSPWWCGSEPAALEGAGNVADKGWQRPMGYADTDMAGAVPFDDGFGGCALIGQFRPNSFGLHDTIGNVAEWCRDVTIPYMISTLAEGNELFPQVHGLQIVRGGHFGEAAFAARSAARQYVQPSLGSMLFGIRPMRPVE